MAIEVVKNRTSLAKEAAEDDVLWSIKVALDIVNSLNIEDDNEKSIAEFNSSDSIATASLLLEQYRSNKPSE